MAQHVMVIAVKLENLVSIPRAHIVGKKSFHKLSYDLHMYASILMEQLVT